MISFRQLVLGAYPDYSAPESLPELPVTGLEVDSRLVQKGSVFIAVRGEKLDGLTFVEEAAQRGACAIISEERPSTNLPWAGIPDSREAVARLASVYFGHPSQKMKAVGITGTNGKTTTTYLVEHILQKTGRKTGAIGTIQYRYAGLEVPAAETTPGPLKLQKIFSEMASAGCTDVVMEVSSHALEQGRVSGVDFACAVFTNLTQDHLDYHGSMEKYFESKAKLFTGLSKEATAVLNADDPYSAKMAALTKARIVTFAIEKGADFRAQSLEHGAGSTRFILSTDKKKTPVVLPLIGRHNVSNALAAIAACESLGIPAEKSASALSDFPGVPGRLEAVQCGQDFTVLIDFAHTPDGLENVLKALSEHRESRLLVVFGCGGDRDRKKRPKMAEIASRWADFVYVTSDNPRSEDPRVIAEEVRAGFPSGFTKQAVVLDRRKAIRQALLDARVGDIVLLAGKGHERSQIMKDQVLPFSDREEAERVLNGR